MVSSGIRLDAWDYLEWKHVIPIKGENNPSIITAAKLIVYVGEPEQYYTFTTPEAYNVIRRMDKTLETPW